MRRRAGIFLACLAGVAATLLIFLGADRLYAALRRPVLTLDLLHHAGGEAEELRVLFATAGGPATLPAAWRVVTLPPGPHGEPWELRFLPLDSRRRVLPADDEVVSPDLLPRLPAGHDLSVRAVAELDNGRLWSAAITVRRTP